MYDDVDACGYDLEMITTHVGYLETAMIQIVHAYTVYALKNKHNLLNPWYKILPPVSINNYTHLITGNLITITF